ncbi:hypothetical protein F0Q32_01600 [Pseudocitrobacter sp. 73]|nr:hypothetical protein F0Q32_01600 [Pseudocitrobacter sp. 73]
MKRYWQNTPDRKEKGHITVAKYTSLNSGMMITNARLSYTQTRTGMKSSVFFKKNHFIPKSPDQNGLKVLFFNLL